MNTQTQRAAVVLAQFKTRPATPAAALAIAAAMAIDYNQAAQLAALILGA